ncbi:Crp/Fnr family transcriptional regulator [Candidatus Venteria ishoeyi]|uniref:Nitrogen fixation regulation protein FixK n=1 Tax=Candidatus Venteria ishoeyi TaxID=1899563 RepID=A0A1H6FH46_9GAMM|nr:Crp/Fnr family transcriptional regulator [Candidatus Venteria ishoeyi]SEH08324.1 Nitrogen fixation regulation protein FixK [Candidatus Venteria ishoeyi]
MMTTIIKPLETDIESMDDCLECMVREYAPCHKVSSNNLPLLQVYRDEKCSFKEKSHLYRQGNPHPMLYTLHSGWVIIYKTLRSGRRQILTYALPGDFIGLQGNFNAPANHSALALTDCSLCAFSRDNIQEMMLKVPEFTLELALRTARNYEFQTTTRHQNAQERIVTLFLDLYHRMQAQNPSIKDVVVLPITQEDIGDTLGLTQVHVNRSLRSLREQELLDFHHQKLHIYQYEALKALVAYGNAYQ